MAKSNYAFTWLGKAEDKEKLHLGLEELTGNDFEAAERAEMTAGNNAPLLMFSKSFQEFPSAVGGNGIEGTGAGGKGIADKEVCRIDVRGIHFFVRTIGRVSIGKTYRRIAVRCAEYGSAEYWMGRTPSELCAWIEEINEHRKDQLEAMEAARRRR